ncbi:hypothetical protein [uncultured Tenacibaculum sp.]|uniref:hypothetical protein n=1 Tax=uncultured Tenacibaculum sp. TaxID=174713 RepID=UPI0026161EF3|nr:hypothetical protein [uncultured Tenacibaculum sp.]
MISILIAILFLGCYLFYNTSQKTTIVSNSYLEKRIRSNEQISKIVGGSFLLITLIIAGIHFGLFSGILFWLVALTMLMSLLIVIAPLKLINYKTLVALFFVLLLIEFIF